jgi:hypothetical protein
MYLPKVKSKITWRKKIFCWRLERREGQDLYPDPDSLVRRTDPELAETAPDRYLHAD